MTDSPATPEPADEPAPEQPKEDTGVEPTTEKEVGTEVAIHTGSAGLARIGPPSATEWAVMKQQADTLAKSNLVPPALRRKPDDIMLIVMTGRELAIPAVMALSRIHVVEGKPTLSAEVMRALITRAGHKVRITERSRERCTVVGIRSDDPDYPLTITFSMDDARAAGLAAKSTWKNYPADMCLARATSALGRAMFPDVLLGMTYAPEDFDATVDQDGNLIVGEVVSETASEPQVQPLDAEATDAVRREVFAAFDTPDPSTALRTIWNRLGPVMDVTMIADDQGELVRISDLIHKAVRAVRDGGRLHDAAQPPAPAPAAPAEGDAPAPGQPDADGIVDAEVVEDGQAPPAPTHEQAVEAAQSIGTVVSDDSGPREASGGQQHGEGEPDGEPHQDDEGAEPPHDPEAEAMLAAGAAPLVPVTGADGPDEAKKHEWLIGEVETLASIFGTKVSTLVGREERSKGRGYTEWSNEDLLTFVGKWRQQAANRLRADGREDAAMIYDGFAPTMVIDVRSMLAQ